MVKNDLIYDIKILSDIGDVQLHCWPVAKPYRQKYRPFRHFMKIISMLS